MEASSAGEYVCEAKNSAGTTSATAVLEIQSVPVVRIRPAGVVKTLPGRRVKLHCYATGNPSPTVSWTKITDAYSSYPYVGHKRAPPNARSCNVSCAGSPAASRSRR